MENKWKLASDNITTMPVEHYKKQEPLILLYKTDQAMKENARDLIESLNLLKRWVDLSDDNHGPVDETINLLNKHK